MVVCFCFIRTALKSAVQGRLMSTVASDGTRWNILSSLCIERKPILSQQMNFIEQERGNVLSKMEFEKSLINDHELQHMEDIRRKKRLMAGEALDSDLEASIQTAQDFEDLANAEMSDFRPAPRLTEADKINDLHSVNRRLDRNLLLLVKPKHSSKWELPTCLWKSGETLRQTAERSVTDNFGTSLQMHILGNAPIGFFKFKYNSNLRKKAAVNEADGGKVFFFRAHYVKGTAALEENSDLLDYTWATREEVNKLLETKQEYLKSVKSFIVEEGPTYTPSEVFARKFPAVSSPT